MALLLQMQYLQHSDLFSSQLFLEDLGGYLISVHVNNLLPSMRCPQLYFSPLTLQRSGTEDSEGGAKDQWMCQNNTLNSLSLRVQVLSAGISANIAKWLQCCSLFFCLPLWYTCSESNSAWSFNLCLWKILVPHKELGMVVPSVISNSSSDPKIGHKFIGSRLCDYLKHVPWALLKITWYSGFVLRSSWYVFTLFSEIWVILLNACQPHMRPYSWLDCPFVFKSCAGIRR